MSEKIHPKVIENCKDLVYTKEQFLQIYYTLLNEINHGLSKTKNSKSDVKCLVTYVQDLPDGSEHGKFLALDFGGSNFRILMIHLRGRQDMNIESKTYNIPQEIMVGTGVKLFDHIADCLFDFIKEHGLERERLPLGFTFAFPVLQLGLSKGILVSWAKEFDCQGVVDENVVQFLNDALHRHGIKVNVVAILNDTTGTLMSTAFKNQDCKIGLIIDDGFNACYLEYIENVELFNTEANSTNPYVIINTEWGSFGNSGKLDYMRTEYDIDLDLQSINPQKHIFEKMISGIYMGELVRLIIEKCINDKCLFNGNSTNQLSTKGSIQIKHISQIESDVLGSYKNCREVLNGLGLSGVTDEDCINVRYICECLSKRSAQLVACGLSVLINKIDSPNVVVGVDGSVYKTHPKYRNYLMSEIIKYVIPAKKFDLVLSEDGAGIGAALVAAVASK